MGAAEKETLNLEESAALVGVGVEAMRELIDAGELPAARLNRKHTVLLREDVIDFIRIKARQQAEERRKTADRKPTTRRRRGAALPDLGRYGG